MSEKIEMLEKLNSLLLETDEDHRKLGEISVKDE